MGVSRDVQKWLRSVHFLNLCIFTTKLMLGQFLFKIFFSQVLEQILNDQIVLYLENNILSEIQFGFRKDKHFPDALFYVNEQINDQNMPKNF